MKENRNKEQVPEAGGAELGEANKNNSTTDRDFHGDRVAIK